MAASDAIEGLVCGYPAAIRERRCCVAVKVLHGYADDSADGGVYLLAGWVATADAWIKFSEDFDRAKLPHSLHMKTARRKHGTRVNALAAITCHRTLYRIDCVLHPKNYEMTVKGKLRKELDSPYFLLFYQLILATARLLDLAKIDGAVNWIFDEQGKIGIEANSWYWWIKERAKSNLKDRLGRTSVFDSDDVLLPLKAADLYAWRLRRFLSQDQPAGLAPNLILESFLSKYGVSCNMTGEYLADLVEALNRGGLLLKANCQFFLPRGNSAR